MYSLFKRHAEQVEEAITQFRSVYRSELLQSTTKPNSLEDVIRQQEYFQTPASVLARELERMLSRSAKTAFASERPDRERVVQDHLQSVLDARHEEVEREFPLIHYGFGSAIPDFSTLDLIIEVKYTRDGTSRSKATESIMADNSKYPKTAHLLFFVYDPDCQIRDDNAFGEAIARVRPSAVIVVH